MKEVEKVCYFITADATHSIVAAAVTASAGLEDVPRIIIIILI